ncbi:MAG: hypothetical protein IIU46_01005 [Treponema sp.]|nr:hypothetical protein [Treponema sp.]
MAKISVSSSAEKEMAQVEKAVETLTVKSKAKGNDAERKVSKRSRSKEYHRILPLTVPPLRPRIDGGDLYHL